MNLWNTLRIAIRTWRRTPALAIVIVLRSHSASAPRHGVHDGLLDTRATVPFPELGPARVGHDIRHPRVGRTRRRDGSNRLPQFADWQQHLKSFEQIGAWAGEAPDVFTVTGAGTPERVSGLRVTHQLLPMLGAMPVAGRLFRQRRRWAWSGRDGCSLTRLLAATLRLAGRTSSVSPSRSRTHPTRSSVSSRLASRFPAACLRARRLMCTCRWPSTGTNDIGGFMAVIGRLRPGVSADQAQAELASRQAALSVGKFGSG